jgi:hypothetical protein
VLGEKRNIQPLNVLHIKFVDLVQKYLILAIIEGTYLNTCQIKLKIIKAVHLLADFVCEITYFANERASLFT